MCVLSTKSHSTTTGAGGGGGSVGGFVGAGVGGSVGGSVVVLVVVVVVAVLVEVVVVVVVVVIVVVVVVDVVVFVDVDVVRVVVGAVVVVSCVILVSTLLFSLNGLVSGKIIKAVIKTINDIIALGSSKGMEYFLTGFIKSMMGRIINADNTVMQAAITDRKLNDSSIPKAKISPNAPKPASIIQRIIVITLTALFFPIISILSNNFFSPI